MTVPSYSSMLCQTDAEYEQLFLRLEMLRTNGFRVGRGTSFHIGSGILDLRADPMSRLVQVQFMESLAEHVQVKPPVAGVPFDFEQVFSLLEKFVADHPI